MKQREGTDLVPAPHGRTIAALERRNLVTRGLAELERSDAEDLFELGLEGFRLLLAIFGQDLVDPGWTAARRAADHGHADAQYWLRVVHSNGHGVSADASEAAKWFRRAAEQGHAAAQFNLGFMHYTGQGAAQDYGEAARWYRRAAEQHHPRAQSYLGVMLKNGLGVPQNDREAVKWFRRARGA